MLIVAGDHRMYLITCDLLGISPYENVYVEDIDDLYGYRGEIVFGVGWFTRFKEVRYILDMEKEGDITFRYCDEYQYPGVQNLINYPRQQGKNYAYYSKLLYQILIISETNADDFIQQVSYRGGKAPIEVAEYILQELKEGYTYDQVVERIDNYE